MLAPKLRISHFIDEMSDVKSKTMLHQPAPKFIKKFEGNGLFLNAF